MKSEPKNHTLVNKARRIAKSSGLKGLVIYGEYLKTLKADVTSLARREIELLKERFEDRQPLDRNPGSKGRSAGHGRPKPTTPKG